MSDALAAAYQQRTANCPRRGNGCPSAEAIAAALRGSGDADTLAALSSCARCAAIAQIEDGLAPRPRVARWPMALAASAVLAIGTATLLSTLRPPPVDATLRGGVGAIRPELGSELDASPAAFRWEVEAAAICRVEVRSSSGELVWKSGGVRGGQVALDRPLPADAYLWIVRCAADELGPFHFRVR